MKTFTIRDIEGNTLDVTGPENGTLEQAQVHYDQEVQNRMSGRTEQDSSWIDSAIGLGNTIGSGASLGFNDEVGGAFGAIPALMPGGESPEDAYRRHRDAIRASQEGFAAENPLAAMGAEAAGGMATGGLGAAKAAGVQFGKNLPPAVKTLGAGGTAGAVAGAGYAPESEDVLANMGTGAFLGAAGGAVAPVAKNVLGGALGTILKTLKTPSKRAEEAVQTLMEEAGIDAGTYARWRVGLGNYSLPADLDPLLQRKLKEVATSSPKLAKEIQAIILNRGANFQDQFENIPGYQAPKSTSNDWIAGEAFNKTSEAVLNAQEEAAQKVASPSRSAFDWGRKKIKSFKDPKEQERIARLLIDPDFLGPEVKRGPSQPRLDPIGVTWGAGMGLVGPAGLNDSEASESGRRSNEIPPTSAALSELESNSRGNRPVKPEVGFEPYLSGEMTPNLALNPEFQAFKARSAENFVSKNDFLRHLQQEAPTWNLTDEQNQELIDFVLQMQQIPD